MESNDHILESIISDVYKEKQKIALLETPENQEKLLSYLEQSETAASIFVAREILWQDTVENQVILNQALMIIIRRIGAEAPKPGIIDWHELKGMTKDAMSIILERKPDLKSAAADNNKKKSKLVINAIALRMIIDYVVCPTSEGWYPDRLILNLDSILQDEVWLKNEIILSALRDAANASGFFHLRGNPFGAINDLNENYPILIRDVIETEDSLNVYVYSFIESLVGKEGTSISDEIVDALCARIEDIAEDIRNNPFYDAYEDIDGDTIWNKGNLIYLVEGIPRLGSDKRIQTAVKDWARKDAILAYDFRMRGNLPSYAEPAFPDLRYERELPQEALYYLEEKFGVKWTELQPDHWIEYGEGLSQSGDYGTAGQAYVSAMELDPSKKEGWLHIADTLGKLGFPNLVNATKLIPQGKVPDAEIGEDLVNFFKYNDGTRITLFLQSRIFRTAPYCDLPDHVQLSLKAVEEDPSHNRRWFELGLRLADVGLKDLAEMVEVVDEDSSIGYGNWLQINDFLETHNCTRAIQFIMPLRDWLHD